MTDRKWVWMVCLLAAMALVAPTAIVVIGKWPITIFDQCDPEPCD